MIFLFSDNTSIALQRNMNNNDIERFKHEEYYNSIQTEIVDIINASHLNIDQRRQLNRERMNRLYTEEDLPLKKRLSKLETEREILKTQEKDDSDYKKKLELLNKDIETTKSKIKNINSTRKFNFTEISFKFIYTDYVNFISLFYNMYKIIMSDYYNKIDEQLKEDINVSFDTLIKNFIKLKRRTMELMGGNEIQSLQFAYLVSKIFLNYNIQIYLMKETTMDIIRNCTGILISLQDHMMSFYKCNGVCKFSNNLLNNIIIDFDYIQFFSDNLEQIKNESIEIYYDYKENNFFTQKISLDSSLVINFIIISNNNDIPTTNFLDNRIFQFI